MQAVGGLLLILALVRLLNIKAVAVSEGAPKEPKGEAMSTNSIKSKLFKALAAITETVWMYGVGVMATLPLPGRHVLRSGCSVAVKSDRRRHLIGTSLDWSTGATGPSGRRRRGGPAAEVADLYTAASWFDNGSSAATTT